MVKQLWRIYWIWYACSNWRGNSLSNQKVISLEGDGSAMYTVQSLWTMARENLDIVILIFANQSYKILQGELKNVGVTNPGKSAIEMLSLKNQN